MYIQLESSILPPGSINDIANLDIENPEDIYAEYQSDAFLVDGFQIWTKNAKAQAFNWSSESDHHFLEVLRQGVQMLGHLRSVSVTPYLWHVDSHRGLQALAFAGSPLMRSWDYRHARPRSRSARTNGTEFGLITLVLAEAMVQIQELSFYNDFGSPGGLRLLHFHAPEKINRLLQPGVTAFSHLTTFKMKFFVDDRNVFDETRALFLYLLSHMTRLKEMSIDISCGLNIDDPRRIHGMYTLGITCFSKLGSY